MTYPDIAPYLGILADVRKTHRPAVAGSVPRRFRFAAYSAIRGRSTEQAGIVVFHDDYGLVLVDGMHVGEPVDALVARVESLASLDFDELAVVINAHPEARHRLMPDGSVPW